jgi:hypothetical protein
MYDDVMNLSGESILERRDNHQLWVLGRLRPGVSLSQASASLQVTTSGLAKAYPSTNKDTALVVVPETHARPNPNIGPVFRVAATAFAALAVLLLLITSANVTNLLMARAVSREREVSLRAALGAGRGRLVRQLLTESIVLALFASAVALPIAALALQNFQQGFAASTAIATLRPDFSLDVRVLIGVLGLTLLAGVVSGLAPALMAARADLNGALKSGSRGASGEPRAWFRSALVVGQVALTLMLLVSGGLFVRSLDHVRRVQLGFDPQHVVVASAVPGESGYDPEQRSAYFTAARDRVLALPGCRACRLGCLDSDSDRERWRALLAREPASESRRATTECRDGSRRSWLLRRCQHTDSRRSRVYRSRRRAGRAGDDRQPDTGGAVVANSERSRPFLRP